MARLCRFLDALLQDYLLYTDFCFKLSVVLCFHCPFLGFNNKVIKYLSKKTFNTLETKLIVRRKSLF